MSAQRFLGVPVEAHPHLESTNDEVFRRARDGAPEGLVVVAEHQTQGRGRLGRSWFDAAGRSLMIGAGGRALAIPEFLAAVLTRFERDVALARRDDPRALFERVRPYLPALGARVRVVLGGRAVEGELMEVTETGALRVRDRASGVVETLAAGVME